MGVSEEGLLKTHCSNPKTISNSQSFNFDKTKILAIERNYFKISIVEVIYMCITMNEQGG